MHSHQDLELPYFKIISLWHMCQLIKNTDNFHPLNEEQSHCLLPKLVMLFEYKQKMAKNLPKLQNLLAPLDQ